VLVGIMRGGWVILGPLTVAILIAIGLVVVLARVTNPVEHRTLVTWALAVVVVTVAVMTVTRHHVRMLYLEPTASLYQLQVSPQWGNFLLFAALLVVSLATVGYLVKRVLSEPATGDQAA